MMKPPRDVQRPRNDHDIARIVDDVVHDGEPRTFEREGKRVRVQLDGGAKEDIWANYDPAAVRQAWRNLEGILKGVDVEQLKRDIREARGQDSIGRPADG